MEKGAREELDMKVAAHEIRELGLERIRLFAPPCSIGTFRCDAPARWLVSGASWPAMEAAAYRREKLVQTLGKCGSSCHPLSAASHRRAYAPWSHRSPRACRRWPPGRCSAFADARRIVAGVGGGRVQTRKAHPGRFGKCGSALPQSWRPTGSTPRHTGVLIATRRCAAPARGGAFDDQRRLVVATTEADRCTDEPPRPGRVARGFAAM